MSTIGGTSLEPNLSRDFYCSGGGSGRHLTSDSMKVVH